MKTLRAAFALAIVGVLAVAGGAQATSVLDFGIIAPTTGSIAYTTTGGPLVGTSIQVDNVVGISTPLNPPPQPRTCFSCALNFTTGSFQSSTATTWTFGPGGSISIVGEVDLNGDGISNDGGSVTLLTGSFNGISTVTAAGGTFKVAIGAFSDVKDTNLLNLYGLPTNLPYIGNFNISFMASGSPPGTFTSTTVLSGDLTNSPTPEPGSLMLLGSGLLGFGYLSRRRRRRGGN